MAELLAAVVSARESALAHEHADVLAAVVAAHVGALVAAARLFRRASPVTLFRLDFVLLRLVAFQSFGLTAAAASHFDRFFAFWTLARVTFRLAKVEIFVAAAGEYFEAGFGAFFALFGGWDLCGSCFAACAEFDVLRQECAGVAWTAVAFCLATVAAAVEGFGTGFGALVFVRFDFELVAVDAPHGCVRFEFLFDDYWTGIARAVVALSCAIVQAAVENFGALTGAHRHAARAAFYLQFKILRFKIIFNENFNCS